MVMVRFIIILIGLLFLSTAPAQAEQAQFFPPMGPCSPENPILAWNGSGATYCTHFPTAELPDCPDGQFLTKKHGVIICSDLSGKTITTPATGASSTVKPATYGHVAPNYIPPQVEPTLDAPPATDMPYIAPCTDCAQ